MLKEGISVLFPLVLGVPFLVTAGILTAAQQAPDGIMIENKYKDDKKGPVKLAHKTHS